MLRHCKGSILLFTLFLALSVTSGYNPKIINGTTAIFENTRHMISIQRKSLTSIFGTGHICGGSLIAVQYVLSAAHCFYNEFEHILNEADDYFVVMGILNRFERTNYTLEFGIVEIVYPDFDRPSYKGDIALIRLDGKAPEMSSGLAFIPLNRFVLPEDIVCQVTGWGLTEKGTVSEDLMTIDVEIINTTTCSLNYGNATILGGMMCAGYMKGERDSCQGDSGGPLVCNHTLVGIVSFGEGCAVPGFPGIYTEVAYYYQWIQEHMKSTAKQAKGCLFVIFILIFVSLQ